MHQPTDAIARIAVPTTATMLTSQTFRGAGGVRTPDGGGQCIFYDALPEKMHW
ncbi:MAG: hypothetical protein KME16_26855 [Scytolyngbya sp. HA4215-MV1]|nr:hypothetical protein [Scytolyngbya sp. HA4215-MV1]